MTLSDYLQSKFDAIYTYMGWDATRTAFIISETLRLYGVDSESEATDTNKLFYFGRVATLQTALDDLSMNLMPNQKASFNKDQLFNQISDLLERTFLDGIQYMDEYKIKIATIKYTENPYDLRSYLNAWL